MKIVSIIGGRPQFIKAVPVSRALAAAGIDEVLVDTGQHYDDNMAAAFVRELGLRPPRHYLEVGSGPHGQMTGRILERVERVLSTENPDFVIVYGDTNSTLGGALAAAKLKLPVAHVEAGLRSYVSTMPEEINRRLVDHISSVLFCPTMTAMKNLEREGIASAFIPATRPSTAEILQVDLSRSPLAINVGDVMLDIAADERRTLDHVPALPGMIPGQYALVTVHRAEATDDMAILTTITEALIDLASVMPVVLPLHPRTRAALKGYGLLDQLQRTDDLRCIAPLGYRSFMRTMRDARVVVTDSGGVQKEAFILGVPCLVLREETEWPELVDFGSNRLVGRLPKNMADAALAATASGPTRVELLGDGEAAIRIAKTLSRLGAQRGVFELAAC
jgi:UDP-N-acetylglucosamine 2-epimerase